MRDTNRSQIENLTVVNFLVTEEPRPRVVYMTTYGKLPKAMTYQMRPVCPTYRRPVKQQTTFMIKPNPVTYGKLPRTEPPVAENSTKQGRRLGESLPKQDIVGKAVTVNRFEEVSNISEIVEVNGNVATERLEEKNELVDSDGNLSQKDQKQKTKIQSIIQYITERIKKLKNKKEKMNKAPPKRKNINTKKEWLQIKMEDLQKKREKLIKKKRRDRFQWMKDSWRWKSDKKDQRTKRDLAIHSFSSPGTYHRFIIIQRVLGLRGPLRVRPLVAIVVVVPKIPSSLLSPTPPFIHCFQIKQPLQPNLVQF